MLDGPGRRVVVLAGTGNNGGDGLVAAQRLAADHEVTVLVAGGPGAIKTPEARAALDDVDAARVRVEAFGTTARAREILADADLVIDALLGIGVTGTLREPVRTMARLANASGTPVLSVDVPTGIGGPSGRRRRLRSTTRRKE
jgi:NAD(P)H-hydrate epimerase